MAIAPRHSPFTIFYLFTRLLKNIKPDKLLFHRKYSLSSVKNITIAISIIDMYRYNVVYCVVVWLASSSSCVMRAVFIFLRHQVALRLMG